MTMTPESMTTETTNDLFLPDLQIKGFRGIKELNIPQLGRVTLLAGRNGVGKTSVLEAVQTYASRGRPSDLADILSRHQEFIASRDDEGDKTLLPDPTALFYGRKAQENSLIEIGPSECSDDKKLNIVWAASSKHKENFFSGNGFATGNKDNCEFVMKISYAGISGVIPLVLHLSERRVRQYSFHRLRNVDIQNGTYDFSEWPEPIEFQSLGPGLLSDSKLEDLWGEIALTDDELKVLDAIRLVVPQPVERASWGGAERGAFGNSRGIIVRLGGNEIPVPLRSLGDGATRLASIALTLAATRDGIVTIDEVENGIHYTAQSDFWKMVFNIAIENNLQVLAATHSFDCVKGFANATLESEGEAGILIRLDRDPDEAGLLHPVIYGSEKLETAAEQEIEVR